MTRKRRCTAPTRSQKLQLEKEVHFYAASQTTRVSYPCGLQLLHFLNKQIEWRHPGGRREILFPDQTLKFVESGGSETTTIFSDGTVVHIAPNVRLQSDINK
ncbi:hypothetical protein JOB18_010177 [Solea senegalensis]|uniref:Centromere protein J C-terminal domain-containing protein n=1 Tax=Solea senegalensis TaxID=28829 RepID=A0AAV6RTK5_SOLSE|nr:hypothetical protein JOB18_010177 [Solea senegalensis]